MLEEDLIVVERGGESGKTFRAGVIYALRTYIKQKGGGEEEHMRM